MKKKQSTVMIAAMLTLGSAVPVMASSVADTATAMPTFSFSANASQKMLSASNDKVFKDLTERKAMLEKTIQEDSFKSLSLGERMGLIQSYFSVRSDIHKENQKTVLSATDILTLEGLQSSLIKESDQEYKDTTLISGLIQELKSKDMSSLQPQEIEASQNMMKKVITSYQELRTAGRDLNILISTQTKVFHSSQLQILNKFGQKFEIDGDKEEALKLNQKMLKLTDGDAEAFQKVANLLTAQKKSFFFVDNEAVEVSSPFVWKNDGTYADLTDMAKVKGLEVQNEEKKVTIKNGENSIVINKEDQSTFYNGVSVGKNFTVLENNKIYVPIHSTFEMFHYDVKWDETIKSLVMDKQVYEKMELDALSADDIVANLFKK